jgi:PTS system mannose-specific IIA component
MSVGIIVTAHGRLASALLEAAEQIMGHQENVAAVDMSKEDGEAVMRDKIKEALEGMEGHIDGMLILTDLFGGSSCTICLSLFQCRDVRVLCGVNMPMLLRAITYKDLLSLDELADKVYQAGREGVVDAGERLREVCLSSRG